MTTLFGDASARKPLPGSERLLWQLIRAYSRGYAAIQDRFKINLKGLGFLLRRLRYDFDFSASGFHWFFDHRIGGTYMRLPGGSFNEPETQAFLEFITHAFPRPFDFIDVGANIGEMVVTMAARPKVRQVVAFEPHPIVAEVCRRNVALNGLTPRVDIRIEVVSDGTPQRYVVDPKYSPTSGIQPELLDVPAVSSTRLDDALPRIGDCVLLIDVECAELDVLKGAAALLRNQRPLVIFEYNYLTRLRYSLADVQDVLGAEYQMGRMRLDGWLDDALDRTFNNVVAWHVDSDFAPLCTARRSR